MRVKRGKEQNFPETNQLGGGGSKSAKKIRGNNSPGEKLGENREKEGEFTLVFAGGVTGHWGQNALGDLLGKREGGFKERTSRKGKTDEVPSIPLGGAVASGTGKKKPKPKAQPQEKTTN